MRRAILLLAPVLVFVGTGAAAPQDRVIATGWSAPESQDHRAAIDRSMVRGGRASILLESTGPTVRSYAVRQRIRADAYRGQRIRLTGWLKPTVAGEGNALWLRVDLSNGDYILDAMLGASEQDLDEARKRGWIKYDLVAEVPADAIGIAFGVRMRGKGQIRGDDLALSVVDRSVPATTIERRQLPPANRARLVESLREQYAGAPRHPVNMGFEEP
jgi:hypothetical protein